MPVRLPKVPLARQVTRGVPVKPTAQVPAQELPKVLFLGQLKLPLGGLAGLTEHVTGAAADDKAGNSRQLALSKSSTV